MNLKQLIETGNVRSFVPSKLLRIYFADYCNIGCEFCFVKDFNAPNKKENRFTQSQLGMIVESATKTNCRHFHLTGGEPLTQNPDYLTETIRTISSIKSTIFWITSNGILLTKELTDRMHDAGLRIMTITIGAETNEKYQRYTHSNIKLDDILKNIKYAVSKGIEIGVHVPLSREGIYNFEQLSTLLDKVSDLGVTEAAYFNLTETVENKAVFRRLFIDKTSITDTFSELNNWQLDKTDEGRYYMTNRRLKVFVPSEISLVTDSCKSSNCGALCQGIYAAYLIKRKEDISIRACHKRFEDGRNVYPIDNALIENKDLEGLTKVFEKVWKFAYEQK